MEVNLENLFVAIGYTPSPPTSKTPNIIVTEWFVSQQKYCYWPWTAPNNFQQHVLEPMITIPVN